MTLQAAQAQQKEHGIWEIVADGVVLGHLPQTLTPSEVIGILEFAQHHEREAYRAGLRGGQEAMHSATNQRVAGLMNHIRALEAHNTSLAETLDNVITNGTEAAKNAHN